MGAILLQIIDGKRHVIKMWSKQWKTMAMRKAPPYYKECAAWMRGLELARVYADAHPMPVKCVTDHIPLTWVKHTSGKGPVSQFVLDNLGSLDYTLEYRPGLEHTEADAASRFPCLGPKILSPEGKKEAMSVLIQALPRTWNISGRLWTHAGKETAMAKDMVQTYQDLLAKTHNQKATNKQTSIGAGDKTKAANFAKTVKFAKTVTVLGEGEAKKRRVPATDRPSVKRVAEQKYGMAIFAPYADKAAEILGACLNKDAPFACLVPISLVNQAPEDEKQKERLRAAKKIVLLDPELVWVIHGVPGITKHQVHARQVLTFGPEPDLLGVLTGPPQFDANTWRPAQENLFKSKANGYNKKNTVLKNGLWYHSTNGTDIRLIVPEEHRDELLTWQHKALLHASGLKVAQALEKHFH